MNISGSTGPNPAVMAESSITMAKKALDAQKVEGRAALGLIEAAGAVAAQGAARPAAADGTGTRVDVSV